MRLFKTLWSPPRPSKSIGRGETLLKRVKYQCYFHRTWITGKSRRTWFSKGPPLEFLSPYADGCNSTLSWAFLMTRMKKSPHFCYLKNKTLWTDQRTDRPTETAIKDELKHPKKKSKKRKKTREKKSNWKISKNWQKLMNNICMQLFRAIFDSNWILYIKICFFPILCHL